MLCANSHLNLNASARAKRIKVWINGKPDCYQMTLNQKEFRTWNSILLHLTDVLQPNFGAIRKLISLKTRREIWNFEELSDNDKYIALGGTSQTRLHNPNQYKTNVEMELSRRKFVKQLYVEPLHFGERRFLNDLQKKNIIVICVTLNGVNDQPPQKVVFNKFDINNWRIIINYITRIMSVPEHIGNICTIHGACVRNASEFQPGYLYVVVPNNRYFEHINYLKIFEIYQANRSKRTSSRVDRHPFKTDFIKIHNVD
ncbi:unnamed protein product [Phyllotreta striolata]|uniref:Doublecortin domain-containing protein n=1 Tax=Phyllotreta striolata TaxID=444603 RepID=A0A9N9TSI9_PHYSR|nr:unnamed protein product [Phyllotreta striolata]